ncbi:MAG: M20/M25/M40 family metallo-hydrolase [Clostridiales bacterium]|nr:M20/M25/M40 family metallo-hydrolase [Clostridiales bacterium]
MLENKILDYIENHAQETLDLLYTIAQIPAPSNHEEKRMEFCRKWLTDMGAKGVYTDEALNVVYPYGMRDGLPVVVFMAHMDVVFPDTTPLPLTEQDGRICCPGVGDDTANLAALMMVAKYVTQQELVPKDCGILFVCNTGEEGMGNLKGSRKICKDYAGRIREFYSFDGTMNSVVNRAVGSARFRVTVKTPGGHSYGKFGNENAIANLAAIIGRIYAIQVPNGGKTTYNVGVIEGGTSVNTIAQKASMLCEYRSDCETDMAYMEERFREIFEEQRSDDVEVLVETVGLRPCEHLDEAQRAERDRMVAETQELLTGITGKETKTGSGSTDCNIPLSVGIPSVCYGCYIGDGAHTREEYIEKDSLKMGYRVAFESVLKYFRS